MGFPFASHHRRHQHHHHRQPHRRSVHRAATPRYTGFVVEGPTSVFGAGTGDAAGTTADGGSTDRPCIALRSEATLDHWFLLSVEGRSLRVIQCDIGPAAWTGRAIDITGVAASEMGFDPLAYPTGAWGVARELGG